MAAPASLDRSSAKALLDELHEAQNEFYAGRDSTALRELLTPEIAWVVPGENAIAGTYRGLEEVFAYFRRRRDLATGTFRMQCRDVLVGDGERIAALTDGTATIAGLERRWSTVGIYDVAGQRQSDQPFSGTLPLIAACWLLPFDQRELDRSGRIDRSSLPVGSRRVRRDLRRRRWPRLTTARWSLPGVRTRSRPAVSGGVQIHPRRAPARGDHRHLRAIARSCGGRSRARASACSISRPR